MHCQQVALCRPNFAEVRLLVPDCRQEAYLSNARRAIDGRQPYRHGPYVGHRAHSETIKIKIRKTNLECPLESIKPKNGVGKEMPKPAHRSSLPWHNPCIASKLRCADPTSPRSGCLYQIADKRLIFQMPGAPSTAVSLIAMAHMWGTGHTVRQLKSKFAKRTWNVLWNQ